MQRLCVYGAGAIGGHLAAQLATTGAAVSVIVRGAHLDAIRRNGLSVHTEQGSLHCHPAATDDPATLGPQDVVFVTLKSHSIPAIADRIAPLLGPQTPVVFIANGIPWWYFQSHGGPHDDRRLPRLDPDDRLRRALGTARNIGGVVYSPCTVVEPGVVKVEGDHSRIELGEPDGRITPRLEAIAALLSQTGFPGKAVTQIRDRIWTKLLINLTFGPIAVLSGSPGKLAMQSEAVQQAARTAIQEAIAMAAAWGCTAVLNNPEAPLDFARRSSHKASILQDLELGRPMEIDALYATPLELARLAGVKTPMIDLLVGLTMARAEAAGLYRRS